MKKRLCLLMTYLVVGMTLSVANVVFAAGADNGGSFAGSMGFTILPVMI